MKRNLGKTAFAVAVMSGALGACDPQSTEQSLAVERHSSALLGSTSLIATATLDRATDFAPFSAPMENGMPQNILGGLGSGLAWAGGTTFLGVPDRGPNATPYANGVADDNTTTFISRFETLDLALAPATSGPLPFTLTPTLQATALLSSATPLVYGTTVGLPSALPPGNGPTNSYFSGRSDNFGSGLSTNPDFARLDPEAIRVSRDGNSVFIADEYGPYIYQFDRATGRRLRSYALPDRFAISHLSAVSASEISENTVGRVTNKGIEGLAITPDGSMLVALVQSPLLQDGGDGGRANRIVTIDVTSGATHEYVYDNRIGSKNFNSSEILALNEHQFLIDTRDGKGLGDGSVAVIKQIWAVDIAGATDVSALSGEAALLTKAVPKKLFLDVVAALTANGIATTQIPAKVEGLAFGPDVVRDGVTTHTLFVANDNDFVPEVAGPNRWYVFGFTDADLAALGLTYVPQVITPRGPELALTKSAAVATAITGSEVTYSLTVQNVGLVPASAVVVTDTLPAELMLTSCSSTGTCGGTPGVPAISFASLDGPGSAAATLTAKLSCAVADGQVIVNHATVAFDRADPFPADDTAVASITAINPPPAIGAVAVDHPVLWPPNRSLHTEIVSYDVSDNCPGTVCSLAVTSDEGAPATDWQIVDPHTVILRADRNSAGPGRTYTITVHCTDSGGAVSTRTTSVLVPHDRKR